MDEDKQTFNFLKPYSKKRKFTILAKILLSFSFVTILIITLMGGVIGVQIRYTDISNFSSSIVKEMRSVSNSITIFIENSKNTAKMLSLLSSLRKIDNTLYSHILPPPPPATRLNTSTAKESAVIEICNVALSSHSEFVDTYVGSKWGGFVASVAKVPKGFDPRKRPWYRQAMVNPGTPTVSPIYMSTSGKPVAGISCAVSSYKNETIGVVGIDISLETLTDLINKISIGKSGYLMLVQGDGTIIANPINPDLNFKNITEVDINGFSELMNSEDIMEIKTGGKKWLSKTYTIENLQWKIIAFIEKSEVFADFYTMLKSMAIIGFVLLLVFIVSSLVLVYTIVKPISKTVSALKNISEGEGDLTARLVVSGNDEISELSEAFNKTIEKIQYSINFVSKESQNLEQVGENLSSNMRETASAVNEISSNIEGVKQQTTEQAKSVSDTSSNIDKIIMAIKQLNTSIEAQAVSVAQSSSAIEEMVASIETVSNTLEKSDGIIKNLSDATLEGKTTLLNSSGITQRLIEESGSLLSASSIIQHIASQTNLLAMNAAIEAAHAGESGKGFAVVADEIRKLAEESSVQGKSITNTLKNLSNEIEILAGSSKNVEEKFNAIFMLTDDVKIISNQITEAMKEQSKGSNEILNTIKNINTVTFEVKTGSKEMLKNGELVAQDVERLDDLTKVIENSMNEMAAGATEINNAVQEVNEITQKNKISIENLANEVNKFKV